MEAPETLIIPSVQLPKHVYLPQIIGTALADVFTASGLGCHGLTLLFFWHSRSGVLDSE